MKLLLPQFLVKDKAAYRAAHESSLILFEAAAKAVKPALVGGKLPNVAVLQAEYVKLQEQKETLYADYEAGHRGGVYP